MRNLTLVIPTYNRPHLLATFVGYLQAERAECQIVIADSSRPEVRNANRALVQRVKLDLNYAEFPVETHPFDKFREAVHIAKTSFCALCADDDLIVLDGVRHCLDALRSNPQAAVAQGYSFSFLCAPDGGMDLGSVLYFTPTIDEPTPLARVAKLFDRYQAATYGIYRTPVLQRIFDTMRPMKSILARELFGSALAAVEGAMIRVPRFSHGRSMDASESYEHWHPLEWFIKDSQGLFAEYHHYRDLMTEQVLQRHDNDRDPAVVRRVLDLIHLRYFARHTPGDALRFIIGQRMAGVPVAEYWQRPEIQVPLYEAARVGTSAPDSALVSAVKSRHGENRTYNLHPAFVAPLGLDPPKSESIDELLQSLHSYRLEVPDAPSKRAPRSTRTQMPPKTITVSILLCNYNDARFLPDSLGAVCNQTRLPEEFIVLDDGSTDDSLEIIEGFARRHPFIRVLKNETNRGLLYSINRALKEARCDFIVWAAADDRLMPNFVERNIQCLRKHPTAGISFSRLAVFRDGSDEIQPFTEATHGVAFDFGTEPQFLSPADLRERLQRSYLWISANAVMASRTALVRAGGFDPELRWHADYFGFWVLALRHGACSIPETLALMRQREQTYSSAGMARHKEQRATLGRLADKLTMGGWRDIGVVVLRSPSLLSPFGGAMLATLLRKPRRWPFAVTYGLWWANHQWGQRPGVVPRMGSRLARMALKCVEIMLTKIGRLVRWAGRA
jgi:glycosyltransferase domain-containing protein